MLFFLILFTFCGKSLGLNDKPFDIVDYINELNTTFKARHYSEFDKLTENQLKSFAGSFKRKFEVEKPQDYFDLSTNGDAHFDAAKNWPECKHVIKDVQVQGNCSSSWAISVTTSIRDRLCIQNGQTDPISAYDVISCCEDWENGCEDGDHDSAFQFFIHQGIVTGGQFQSHKGCKPYPFDSDTPRPSKTKCVQKCEQGFDGSYEGDKIYGEDQLPFQYNNRGVMKEIKKNGPLVARLKLYEDLLYYSGGVYQHITGKLLGYHYVKVVGWGVDKNNGKSYWKAINSYGFNWGEKGAFRILRGSDECGFEADLIAAKVKKVIKSTQKPTEPTAKQTTTPKLLTSTLRPSLTCQNIIGVYNGTFKDETIDEWTFDAQFQFKANASLKDRQIYYGIDLWNQTNQAIWIGFMFDGSYDRFDCVDGNTSCVHPFPDRPVFNMIYIRSGYAWGFDIIDFVGFENSFKLENVIGKCTKSQPLHYYLGNWKADPSFYSYCVCCGDYDPHPSLNCPPNPWQIETTQKPTEPNVKTTPLTTTPQPTPHDQHCQKIIGYYVGKFQRADNNSWTFDAQFQFEIDANLQDQKIYYGITNWNQSYSNGNYNKLYFDFNSIYPRGYFSCKTPGQNCSAPFVDQLTYKTVHIETDKVNSFRLFDVPHFYNVFKLENTINGCVNYQPIDPESYYNQRPLYTPDQSLFSYCICCNEYNPHSSLNCPSNPWK